MKVKYSKDVDILMVELSSDPIEYAQRQGSVIVHFSKKRQPVALEIMDAKDLLRKTYRSLPHDVEKEVVTSA